MRSVSLTNKMINYPVVSILLLLNSSLFFTCSSLKADFVCLATDSTGVTVCFDDSLFSLAYIKNDRDSIGFESNVPLWSITMLDLDELDTDHLYDISCAHGLVDCSNRRDSVYYADSDSALMIVRWEDVIHRIGDSQDLDVQVNVRILPGSSLVSFWIIVHNDTPGFSLFNVDFPRYMVSMLSSDGDDQYLAFPWRSHGNLIKDPIVSLPENSVLDQGEYRDMGFRSTFIANPGRYPGFMSAQFFSYYSEDNRSGLFAQTTDELGYLKTFHVVGKTNALECYTRHFPENNDRHADGVYELPYSYRMGPFSGDWIDASKMYRDWLLDSDILYGLKPLGERLDFQAVVDRFDYAMFVNPDTTYLLDALRFFGEGSTNILRAGGRLNYWGFITPNFYTLTVDSNCAGWDNPVSPETLTDIVINDYDGVVLPYTNLFDPPWSTFDDIDCKVGKTCSDGDSIWVQTIAGDSISSEYCHPRLCSAAREWQDHYIAGIGETMGDSLRANGIYSDTRGQAVLCYAGTAHDHPNGGGAYFIQGRKEIAEALDSLCAAGDRIPIANEGPMDIKIGWYDFYLSDCGYLAGKSDSLLIRLIDGAEDIPILPAIMHDYQATISGLVWFSPNDYDTLHFAFGEAYVFVNGHLPGFNQATTLIDSMQPSDQDDYRYLRDLITFRKNVKEYLVYGEWMRSPELNDVDSVEVHIFDNVFTVPSVLSSAFLNDTDLGLVFTNFTPYADTIKVDIDVDNYGISSAGYDIYEIAMDGSRTLMIENISKDPLSKELVMRGKSTRIFEIVTH